MKNYFNYFEYNITSTYLIFNRLLLSSETINALGNFQINQLIKIKINQLKIKRSFRVYTIVANISPLSN